MYAHVHFVSGAALVRRLGKNMRALLVPRHAAHLEAEVTRGVIELAEVAETLQPGVKLSLKPLARKLAKTWTACDPRACPQASKI